MKDILKQLQDRYKEYEQEILKKKQEILQYQGAMASNKETQNFIKEKIKKEKENVSNEV
tara:strand:+ start:3033 stop:3209 length:177 start_codon:yes stop_codon:yes gene_type:complete